MPSFDGSHAHDWLGEIEHFFAFGLLREEDKLDVVAFSMTGKAKKWFAWVLKRGGFRDWVDFKQKLLIRFSESIIDEPETKLLSIQQTDSFDQLPHCPSKEVNLNVSGFMAEAVPETELVRKTTSQSPKAISEKFGDCHVQNHSSPELILKNDTLPASDHEKESIKPEMILVFDNVKEVYGLSQKKLQDDLILKKESAISVFEALVQQGVSSNDEDYHETDSVCASLMMQDAVGLHFEEFTGNSLLWYSPNVDLRSSSSVWHCWKNKHLQNGSLKQGMLQVQIQNKTDQIFMQKRVEGLMRDIISRKLIAGRLRQNIVNGEFKLKHKWRYKLIHELFLNSAVITRDIAIRWDNIDKVWVTIMLFQRLLVQPKQQHHKCFEIEKQRLVKWDITVYRSLLTKQSRLWFYLRVDAVLLELLIPVIFSQVQMLDDILSVFQQSVATNWASLMLTGRDNFWPGMFSSLHHDLELSDALWQWFCFESQPYRSYQTSSLLIFLSTSLGSSLFSRVGVCKGRLTSCLIMVVLIWLSSTASEFDLLKKDDRKQWKNEVVSIQRLFHVIIHLVLKGRRVMVLMCIKRHLLHRLIHHKQIWKKYYKARRFKYKERTGRLCNYMPDGVLGAVLVFLGRDGELSSLDLLHQVVLTKLEGKLVFKGGVLIDMVYHMLLTWKWQLTC